ncbi:4Fe-4S cluster-binding domain-containing protein [Virgibacillus sp. AGTR]|uniref:4Fe-4S cluster-binding domain-containing protein n=1 Tax=Virgibacillus TaxID=84406 RepID=UPI00040D1C08|nr:MULTISPECIES: 4Fe-4S cluster-binding domain-containing protein [Bacillaceae]MCC2249381.1 4Fe-4S cluster-binding domain-containing protein [Virgibacillus sp. AGTR]QRZ18824.1 4Fe-4S cluster-binding domain-containing protein [Virgibacillus sp. AGTR]WBX81603.1 4Fe-4S cluster-binding domain-containing protein [Virgibacillus salarius]
MKLYNNFIRTFTDLPNHTTLLIHSLSGCPLHCLGCHNYEEIIANTPKEYKTTNDLYDYLKKSGFLFDAIMFSGGEFLINPLDEVRDLLQQVRALFGGRIIVTTSGIYYQKVRALYAENLVDGIHIDMKLPYHVLDIEEDAQIYKDVMGITPSKKLVDQLIASVDAVIEHNSILDQVRTVQYPLLDEAFFTEIKHFVEERKASHRSIVPYFLNEFVYPRS